MDMTFENAMDFLLESIRADYRTWNFTSRIGDAGDAVRTKMIAEFDQGLRVEQGRKYAKVIAGGSVWGFVVLADNDKKFRRGDILKAASWAAPARNHARGNMLEGGYTIRWTGPLYM